jgi:hypothetical protein
MDAVATVTFFKRQLKTDTRLGEGLGPDDSISYDITNSMGMVFLIEVSRSFLRHSDSFFLTICCVSINQNKFNTRTFVSCFKKCAGAFADTPTVSELPIQETRSPTRERPRNQCRDQSCAYLYVLPKQQKF